MRPLRKVVAEFKTAKSKIKWDEVPRAEQSLRVYLFEAKTVLLR